MALSDRIALLRNGALEQVAAPREIYAYPATAYCAQFIGQTNLLNATVQNGVATCGALKWPTSAANDSAVFSLRPEAIQLAPDVLPVSARFIRFRGVIQQQIYGGASELLEIECGAGQPLRARISARNSLSREQEFSFSADDVVQVKG